MTPAQQRALDLHPYVPVRARQFDDPDPAAIRRNRIRRSIADGSWPEKIAAFRSLFCLDQHNLDSPGQLRPERTALHRMLLQEEFGEVMSALETADPFIETVDGLLDLIYIALGWLSEMGLPAELIGLLMDEVHASNLTKADSNGLPIFRADGKVLKSEHYVRPDLAGVIASYLGGLTNTTSSDTIDVPENTEAQSDG